MSDALTPAAELAVEKKTPSAPPPAVVEKKSRVLAVLLVFQLLVAASIGFLVFRHITQQQVQVPAAPAAPDGAVADHEGTHAEPAKAKPAEAAHGAGKASGSGSAAAKGAHDAPAETTGAAAGLSDRLTWAADGNAIWHELETGNERFVSGKLQARDVAARRTAVATGQHPPAMILACADSRVPPELLFDQGLGDLFVVRTAGNVADPMVLASFEYAAEHLGARLLVVLGHERCGAVSAAVAGGEAPSENLKALLGEIAPSVEKLRGRVGDDVLVQRSVEENALHEAERMAAESPILRDRIEKHQLEVIAAAYDLDTGKVVVLHPTLAPLETIQPPAVAPPLAKHHKTH
jgi:carbonic anhydrase